MLSLSSERTLNIVAPDDVPAPTHQPSVLSGRPRAAPVLANKWHKAYESGAEALGLQTRSLAYVFSSVWHGRVGVQARISLAYLLFRTSHAFIVQKATAQASGFGFLVRLQK